MAFGGLKVLQILPRHNEHLLMNVCAVVGMNGIQFAVKQLQLPCSMAHAVSESLEIVITKM
jgi:hypothetical protein